MYLSSIGYFYILVLLTSDILTSVRHMMIHSHRPFPPLFQTSVKLVVLYMGQRSLEECILQ